MDENLPPALEAPAEKEWELPPIPEIPPEPGELALLGEEILRRLDEIAALFRESHQHKDDHLLRLQLLCSSEAERRAVMVLRDVTRLHDTVGRTVAAFRGLPPEELAAEKVLKQLAGLEDDIEMLLDQHEVSIFREDGDTLVPQRQLASRIELTDDPSRIGLIAARLRPGFLYREQPLVKERVAVFAQPKGPDGPLMKKSG